MPKRKNTLLFLLGIAALAVLGAFFIFPRGFGARVLPWRLGLDLVGGSHLVYEIDMTGIADTDREFVHEGLRDVIERRVNRSGVREPQVRTGRSGESYRLTVELAGVRDISQAIKEIGETPFLIFAETETVPAPPEAGTTTPIVRFKPTELTGQYVKGAQMGFSQLGQPEILLNFSSEGAELFQDITERNVGKPVGIFLDGTSEENLISAPIVQEKISGGNAQITGTFTLEEARTLIERFNAGALPAPMKLINQQTVGASLGVDSLRKTIWAGTVGTLLVMIFMVVYYGRFGLFASAALLIYIVLILGISKLFGITMTLAAVAGIVLSIGMAVDANVLIFERTNEEKRRGIPLMTAIEEGFRRAWLSIRDSNITTMITSVVLYFLTTGFIQGFALSLLVGVVISMFSAITVTRNIMRVFVE